MCDSIRPVANESSLDFLGPFIPSIFIVPVFFGPLGYFLSDPADAWTWWKTFLLVWVATTVNFWMIGQFTWVFIRSARGKPVGMQVLWVFLKFFMLAFLGWLLFTLGQSPRSALICGLANLATVPLVGGGLWAYREAKKASSSDQ